MGHRGVLRVSSKNWRESPDLLLAGLGSRAECLGELRRTRERRETGAGLCWVAHRLYGPVTAEVADAPLSEADAQSHGTPNIS